MRKQILMALVVANAMFISGCSSLLGSDDQGEKIIVKVTGYPLTVAKVQGFYGAAKYENPPQHVLAAARNMQVITMAPTKAAKPILAIKPPEHTAQPNKVEEEAKQAAPVSSSGREWVVHFDFDRSELNDDEKKLLSSATFGNALVVVGYADAIGSRKYNKPLSKRRAEAVKKYLISIGVPEEQITIDGKGEDNPVDTNATTEGRANNRRAVVSNR
jgi:outer membrane protein OmpA-like peptidoglycan-associated protein